MKYVSMNRAVCISNYIEENVKSEITQCYEIF